MSLMAQGQTTGLVVGWVGDRFGRKQALIWSVLAMAFPSFFIGLLPSAETIGVAAPVLLLLFRLMQGLAVGGEYMASAVFLVEGSQPGRRGWMGSWGPLGATAGTLLGSMAGALVNRALPPDAVMAYGWRLPFLAGLAVGLGGLAIRSHFVERVPHQAPAKSPLGEAFREHWRTMLHLVSLIAGISVGFYTVFVYSVTWLEQQVGVPARTALEINTLAMAAHLFVLPAAGWASDRWGRRRVLMAGSGAFALLAYPLMSLMAQGQTTGLVVGWVGLSLMVAVTGGAMPATMAELAPWRVRCTVLSVAYNIGMALLGGTTPLVAAWLVGRSGVTLAPAWFLSGAAACAFIGALLLPATTRHSLTKEFQAAGFRRS
jgi:MHS family proline/betaine transporter-like MFS transporter